MNYKMLNRWHKKEKEIFKLLKALGPDGNLEQLGYSTKNKTGFRFPIYLLQYGKNTKRAIPITYLAGVHGIEAIGIQVLFDFIHYIAKSESCQEIQDAVSSGRLIFYFIPIVNPGGFVEKSRSNPAGIDLMRNSGENGEKALPFFGGQKLSKKLPYYRGNSMQLENRILKRFIKERVLTPNNFVPVIDIHSGYGKSNHLWWPPAGKLKPLDEEQRFQDVADFIREKQYINQYAMHRQNLSYRVHGDIWDLLFEESIKENSGILPFTLEIGTWHSIRQLWKPRDLFKPPKSIRSFAIRSHRDLLKKFAEYELLLRNKVH